MKKYTDIENLSLEELRALAKEHDVQSWHVKKEDRLIADLTAIFLDAEETEEDIITATDDFIEESFNTRVQIARNNNRLGVLRRDLHVYLRDGWEEIDAE